MHGFWLLLFVIKLYSHINIFKEKDLHWDRPSLLLVDESKLQTIQNIEITQVSLCIYVKMQNIDVGIFSLYLFIKMLCKFLITKCIIIFIVLLETFLIL